MPKSLKKYIEFIVVKISINWFRSIVLYHYLPLAFVVLAFICSHKDKKWKSFFSLFSLRNCNGTTCVVSILFSTLVTDSATCIFLL